MGWRTQLAKKDYQIAKGYVKKFVKHAGTAKKITREVLNALPTVNTESIEQDYNIEFHHEHRRRKRNRKRDSYLDQLL